MARAERSTDLPEVGKLNEQARIGSAKVPYRKWATLPALDGGADWFTTRHDVGEDKRGKQVRPMRSTFHRATRVNAGRLPILGRYQQLERIQTGRANQDRPYKNGQELTLKITEDSGWRKKLPHIPWKEQTPRERRWTAARVIVPFTMAAVVAIGGDGNRMPSEARVEEAKERSVDALQGMTGREQFQVLYINGGDAGSSLVSFDDTSGLNILNMGLSRFFAERDYANVALGDDCLQGKGYDTTGRQAAYKETPDGRVAIVSQGGARLLFALEDGILQPSGGATVSTLTSYGCNAEAIPGGLVGTGEYEDRFTIPFTTDFLSAS